jgi:rhodanese-related sulfurtransferase
MVLTILPRDAAHLLQSGTVEVIDVRERHEWVTGHIAGARHVPLSRFRQSPKAHLQGEAIIFVCAAGARSQLAAQLAAGCGCERAYNLVGGTRAWVAAGLELIVPSEQPAQAAV